MTFGFIRALFVLASTIVGFQLGSSFYGFGTYWPIIGGGLGTGLAFGVIFLEQMAGKISLRGLSAAVFGLILALMISRFLTQAVDLIPQLDKAMGSSIKLVSVLVLCYL